MSDLVGALQGLKVRAESGIFNAYPSTGRYSRDKYPHHLEAFEMTATYRTICGTGGNRSGKSFWLDFLIAVVATGLYPDWWKGRRYDRPLKIWVIAHTAEQTRDLFQFRLFGNPVMRTPGLIPAHYIVGNPSKKAKPDNAWSDVGVLHVPTGGTTQISFLSHEKGQMAVQGSEVDLVAIDEIPRQHALTSELFTRTIDTKGYGDSMFIMIGTALKEVPIETIERYMLKDDPTIGRFTFSTYDAAHLSKEELARQESGYSDEEKMTRMHGIPMLGSSRIMDFDKSRYVILPPHDEPLPHWRCWNGHDEGSKAGFAFAAYAPEEKRIHIYDSRLLTDRTYERIMQFMWENSLAPYWCDTSLRADNRLDNRANYTRFVERGFQIRFPNKKLKEFQISRLRTGLLNGSIVIWDTPNNKRLLTELLMYSRDENYEIVNSHYFHVIDSLLYLMAGTPHDSITYAEAKSRPKHALPPHLDVNIINDMVYEPWSASEEQPNDGNLSW
jgi:hypothetical protein